MNDVLDTLIIQPALEFRPDGKDAKDLDIGHIARNTAVLKDLLRIYEGLSPTREQEKESFKRTIETLQQTLFPWITKPKDGSRTYTSFFDLTNSYTQDAGIVISTGKEGGFRWAVHQIIALRGVLNSTLPIEVFYGGDDDLSKPYRDFLHLIESAFPESGSITTVDITEKFPDPDELLGLPGGWAMRPFAILASSFKTVILADADAIFLQDPRKILDEVNLQKFGSMFWHDRILGPASEETYKWADELLETAKAKNRDNLQASGWFNKTTFYEMERYFLSRINLINSGALVIDKTRNLAGVLMACHLNTLRVRDEITYQKFYGDKESYWFSHALTSTPYHFVPGYSGGVGQISHPIENYKENPDKEQICTLQLLHVLESTGEPLWFNNALTVYKGANDDTYIDADGWVGHDGHWHGGGSEDIPSQLCVDMPGGGEVRAHRVDGELKWKLDSIIQLAKKYDSLMEDEGLVKIVHQSNLE